MLTEKKVVTCFLESAGEILILRRSEKVGSYQGRWAGVSGYIETAADSQALVEISEETGLSENDIEFVRKGDALVICDKELATKWIVHPYLFHVENRDKVKIDWEHKELRWIRPEELSGYATVPMLRETLACIWDV